MEKNSNEKDNSIVKRIFSTQGILVVIALLMVYWVFFKDDGTKEVATYQTSKSVIGVSNSLNQEAVDRLGVDLTENLDPSLISSLVEQAMKETVNSGATEAEFVQILISNVSNKIRDISTIDLNEDGLADPILVVPQNISEGESHLQLSILIPDPAEVKTFPSGSDQEAWADIAENKSIEIMTTTAVKESDQNMTIQTAANPQMYQSHPPYYHHHSSLTSILMTSMMLNWMFMPRFYGPGMGFYGGGGYAPQRTTVINQNRGGATSQLSKGTASQSAAKNASGKAIASNNFKQVPPKSLNQIKSTQFRSRNTAATRTGVSNTRPSSQSSVRQSQPTRRSPASSSRRSGGFGRSRR